MVEKKSKKDGTGICTLNGVTTFSEQYLALTQEERESFLPNIHPKAGLEEDDLAVVIADLKHSNEEFLHVEILKFLSQFPESPRAKAAILSVLKQDKPDDMVLSHAGQQLVFFSLSEEDFDTIHRCLVAIHGDEEYENASASLVRMLATKRNESATATLHKFLDAEMYVESINTWTTS